VFIATTATPEHALCPSTRASVRAEKQQKHTYNMVTLALKVSSARFEDRKDNQQAKGKTVIIDSK
jgi:hypothetical protein